MNEQDFEHAPESGAPGYRGPDDSPAAPVPQDGSPVQAAPVIFEDLTLAEALGYLFWRPARTARLFWRVLTYDPAADADANAASRRSDGREAAPPEPEPWDEDEPQPVPHEEPVSEGETAARDAARWMRPGALAAAILLALQGGVTLHAAALDPVARLRGDTRGALMWFVLSGALVVGAELYAARGWWARRLPRAAAAIHALVADGPAARWRRAAWAGAALLALALALIAPGGIAGAAILLALSAALWTGLLIGLASPEDALPDQPEGDEPDGGDEAVFHVRSMIMPAPAAQPVAQRSTPVTSWLQVHTPALALIPAAVLLSGLAYRANVQRAPDGRVIDVVLTSGGVILWALSIALWVGILLVDWRARRQSGPRPRAQSARPARRWWRQPDVLATALALLAMIAVGAYFRLHNLDSTPPEMTSDHIEKLLDALRVSEGHVAVFFPNNGGREGFQMMVVAFIADVLGVGFNFRALKLASAIEGILTLPALWWMARQIIGTETARARRLGNWVGLALAGLVAISSWHVMLSRLGLRIVLTPLTTALAIGFLARAMRHNRMRDFVALGLTLGAGVYFYQANRMLPVLAVIGVALAALGTARRWRDVPRIMLEASVVGVAAVLPVLAYAGGAWLLERSERANLRAFGEQLGALIPLAAMAWFAIVALAARARRGATSRYGGGLLAAAVIALALYLPMHHYSLLYPDEFWNRTRGRLFGEETFWRIDPDTGQTVVYHPSLAEQIERIWEQRGVLVDNYADALRMAHWQGDSAWINNAQGHPALDGLTGGLLILGLVLWGVRVVRQPAAVDWLVPAVVLVMLLPSALTLAYTIENPSFTRASGAIPAVFLLAALPLGALGAGLSEAPRERWRAWVGAAAGLAAIALVLAGAIGPNWRNYFTDYRLSYSHSWKPYHAIAAPMKAFALGEGSYGNAFMVAYPHWLDHRILGAVAGDLRWPNGLVTREQIFDRIAANRGTPYAYDPSKPLFIMIHPQDYATAVFLEDTFPGGTIERYTYTYETTQGTETGEFLIYRVMAGFIGLE